MALQRIAEFVASIWERLSFCGMQALLMLYMTENLLKSDPADPVYRASKPSRTMSMSVSSVTLSTCISG